MRSSAEKGSLASLLRARRSIFGCAVLLLTLSGCRPAAQTAARQTAQFGPSPALGTTYTVKIVVPEITERERLQVQRAIEEAIERVDALMSTYRSGSELSRWNRHRGSDPFPLSEETFQVLSEAIEVSRLSGGAFDVTIGPLVDAWGFGPPGQVDEPPDEAQIERLRRSAGWDKIELDEPRRTARKTTPELSCDLSAIAKGFAVDQVAETLHRLGYVEHMVEIGGEVRAAGANLNGSPWRIGVERPIESEQRQIQRVIPLENLSMATSGDYRNYYERDGVRISHTLDARTGRPIRHRVASVTVVHPSCMTADAWATALLVLGEQEGAALAEQQDLAAMFLVRTPEGGFEERLTPEFEKRIAPAAGRS